jgi:hypothetical protein
MASKDMAVVAKADFESLSRKLGGFIQELTPNEKEIVAWMLGLAGWSPSLRLSPHYKPRGAKILVLGGADGLTVLYGRSGFKVLPPEGPLPTDFLGFGFVPSENSVGQGV